MYSNLNTVRQIKLSPGAAYALWAFLYCQNAFVGCCIIESHKQSSPSSFTGSLLIVIALVITSKLRSLFTFSLTWSDIPFPVCHCVQRSPFNKPTGVFLFQVQLPFATLPEMGIRSHASSACEERENRKCSCRTTARIKLSIKILQGGART